ncbi:acyltransferase [Edaphobacter sp. 12200R-103]|uniref:acyltransferase family protein n=1 Tax=Edaphobacter sp. 12200R-103 TaxID=2703788 RepID=UPI00138BAA36|nr:acyltransferase [Edaphobacter sp. 12200R-103]QHS52694.1 acyltransferase [Edaphobacter sp. 12200R-103]
MSFQQSAVSGRSWRRVDGIDLLRGLSIFLVLMNHVNMRLLSAHVPYTKGMPPQMAATLVWSGQYGVQIFFAVSGFLITSTSMRRWRFPGGVSLKEFYTLRVARIAPLMLLLLAVLSVLHLSGVHGYVVSEKVGGLKAALAAALTFRINVLEATRGYLPAGWDILWSLSVEEVFYLFFPVVALLSRRTRMLVPLLLVFAMAGPFARAAALRHNPVWYEYSYLGGMDAIAMGCLTAILTSGRELTKRVVWWCTAFGMALLILILGFSIRVNTAGLGRNGLSMTILALGACLVIAAAASSGWRAPRLLEPVLALGRLSYEIYLTHIFVVMGLFSVFLSAGKPMRGVAVLFAGVIVCAGLLGLLVSKLYTEPMNLWIRARAGKASQEAGMAVAGR